MKDEPIGGPRLIGAPVDYADGAEDELFHVIAEADDPSSRSEELASHIHDWPTKYHLSPLRSNLLRPLIITEDLRIVDVGAGTGAIARYLGEHRAHVLAVEGSEVRARIAEQRCRDLESVEVVAGDIAGLEVDEPFDLAVVIGVLEYAAAPLHGPEAGIQFLTHLAGLVADDGAIALAIENRLGLKYLLGLPEDHLGEPGIGVEGYAADSIVQTFSRRRLAEMLEEVGLPSQRWLFPFPDYKLPTVVIGDTLYELEDAPLIIDQIVRDPVVSHDNATVPWMDPRRAHLSFVEAGLGPDVANSFLVVAGRDNRSIDRFVQRDELAWLFGDQRRSVWLRDRALVQRDSSLSLELRSGGDHSEEWLQHSVDDRVTFEMGRSIEQLAVEACRIGDRASLTAILDRWLEAVSSQEVRMHEGDTHPFSPIGKERALSARYLDINLDNFIERDDDSRIVFIDTEWSARGPVSFPLVAYRGLWWFAQRVLGNRAGRMWPPDITVEGLAVELGALAGLDTSNSLRDRFLAAESQLQQLVSGGGESLHAEDIARVSNTSIQPTEQTMHGLKAESEHRLHVINDLQTENEHRLQVIEDLVEIRGILDSEVADLRSVLLRVQEDLRVERQRRAQVEEAVRANAVSRFLLRNQVREES